MKKHNKTKSYVKKKIWIDLDNTPHVVFFRPIIEEFQKRGYQVVLTARACFQVCELADRFNMPYKRIGRHYGKNRLLKVAGLFIRSFQLIPFVLKEKPAIALSHGSRSQMLLAEILGIPSILIFDYEFTKRSLGANPSWMIVPDVLPEDIVKVNKDHVLKYPGTKEHVYVSDFKPDPSIREELGTRENDLLVTIRPPATEAHYHSRKSEELFEAVIDFLSRTPNLRMVLLPRNEKQEALLRKTWPRQCNNGKIIIPDHVVDGLNLIWHSDLVISGGGTMNREAAALGVPVYSIFQGKIGAVDQYLANSGRLVLLESVEDVYTKIILNKRRQSRKIERANRVTLHTIVNEIIGIVER
jgi:predicted glycosyltransferase